MRAFVQEKVLFLFTFPSKSHSVAAPPLLFKPLCERRALNVLVN